MRKCFDDEEVTPCDGLIQAAAPCFVVVVTLMYHCLHDP